MERAPEFIKVLSSVAMSADIPGTAFKPLEMKYYKGASFQAFYEGGGNAVGVLGFLVSNRPDAVDPTTNLPDLTKFTRLVPPDAWDDQQADGSLASGWFPLADMACAWLLPDWDYTSGSTGTLTVYAVAR
jgi:hypothetical protein